MCEPGFNKHFDGSLSAVQWRGEADKTVPPGNLDFENARRVAP